MPAISVVTGHAKDHVISEGPSPSPSHFSEGASTSKPSEMEHTNDTTPSLFVPDIDATENIDMPCSRYDKDLSVIEITQAYIRSICSNIIDNPKSINCDHVFCNDRIKAGINICQYCPIYMEPLRENKTNELSDKMRSRTYASLF